MPIFATGVRHSFHSLIAVSIASCALKFWNTFRQLCENRRWTKSAAFCDLEGVSCYACLMPDCSPSWTRIICDLGCLVYIVLCWVTVDETRVMPAVPTTLFGITTFHV